MKRRISIVVGVLLAIVSVVGAQQPQVDLVLSNGKIITVDERFTIAQAVAIAGDRVVAVGTNQDMLRLAGPRSEERRVGKECRL